MIVCKSCGIPPAKLTITHPNGDVYCSIRCEMWEEVLNEAISKLNSLTQGRKPAMLEGQGRDGLMGGHI